MKRVMITSVGLSTYWYEDRIGAIFSVEDNVDGDGDYTVILDEEGKNIADIGYFIDEEDCEVIEE